MPKINKKHGGKEFKSYFKFLGKVQKHIKGIGNNTEIVPIYQEKESKNKNQVRMLQFDIQTNTYNKLKVEMIGSEQDFAYPYSSTHKAACKVKWDDRFDKTKYPDGTYHLIEPEWDKALRIGQTIKEGDWVEVWGSYKFGSYTDEDGKTYPVIKRMISDLVKIENKIHETKLNNKEIKYVCDFNSEEFVEINYFDIEIGIRSIYFDEEADRVLINGVYLDYGKEKSIPANVPMFIPNKKIEGKRSLAEAFLNGVQDYDFVEVAGVDHNRPEFSDVVEEVVADDDNPFNDLDEDEVVDVPKRSISGRTKGLEVTGVVNKVWIKGMLTDEEIEVPEEVERVEIDNSDDDTYADDDLPF